MLDFKARRPGIDWSLDFETVDSFPALDVRLLSLRVGHCVVTIGTPSEEPDTEHSDLVPLHNYAILSETTLHAVPSRGADAELSNRLSGARRDTRSRDHKPLESF